MTVLHFLLNVTGSLNEKVNVQMSQRSCDLCVCVCGGGGGLALAVT